MEGMGVILLLDDDLHFRRLVTTTLSGRGHEVLEAPRCSDADKLLESRVADLLIVDGLLPDGDGIQWIERFRARDSATPIFFVSAFWKKDARLKSLPVTGVLGKPLTPEQLVSKVNNVLRTSDRAAGLGNAEVEDLAALRRGYERDLPGLLNGVRQALVELRLKPLSTPLRGVARRRAHQVAGTAGCFGYTAIGDSCSEIEQGLLLLDSNDSAGWPRIDRAVSMLSEMEEIRMTA
jgi:CheY-like chemotaxis protein